MRITILQGAFLPVPPLRGGAIEKAWSRLGRAFAEQGCKVTHVSRLCDGLPDEEELEGVRHLRVPGFEAPKGVLRTKWCDLRYVLRARRVLPPGDVLVTHAFWAPLLVRNASRGALYVHVGRYPKGQMRWYGRAARLQAPSEAIAEAIRREAPGSADNAVALPYPLPWDLGPAAEPGEASRDKVVLYLGRIHPEKGLMQLVEAFAGLRPEERGDWRLEVRGPWRVEQGGAGRVFLQELKGLGERVGKAVSFHEPLFGEDELRSELQRAGLFAYPSLAERGETFGLAALEAMSCGCPPLVSGLGCFRDFVEEGKTGFVFDHRSAEVAQALRARLAELLADAAEPARKLVGAAGREAAKAYQVEGVATRFLEDFRRVVGKSG